MREVSITCATRNGRSELIRNHYGTSFERHFPCSGGSIMMRSWRRWSERPQIAFSQYATRTWSQIPGRPFSRWLRSSRTGVFRESRAISHGALRFRRERRSMADQPSWLKTPWSIDLNPNSTKTEWRVFGGNNRRVGRAPIWLWGNRQRARHPQTAVASAASGVTSDEMQPGGVF